MPASTSPAAATAVMAAVKQPTTGATLSSTGPLNILSSRPIADRQSPPISQHSSADQYCASSRLIGITNSVDACRFWTCKQIPKVAPAVGSSADAGWQVSDQALPDAHGDFAAEKYVGHTHRTIRSPRAHAAVCARWKASHCRSHARAAPHAAMTAA